MVRKPAFWIVFVVLCALATWFAVRNFPRAFPLVTLDLKMDRQAALDEAKRLADSHGWGPKTFRQAAQFQADDRVQAFVELEAGGSEAFARLLKEGLYQPYAWHVRHFQPHQTNETLVRFTPAGEPYGFREKIPENEKGAALEPEQARRIAEQGAAAWPVALSEYEPVETSRDVRPSGRIDHTFVYERPDRALGEGRYRLRLAVSGDRLTELTHFVKVPEGFERRYEEMRSANNAIALGAVVGFVIILGIGGCIVGLFLLLRQRWVIWKQALVWGLIVGALEAAVYFGYWPLLWMDYDTAVSATNFALQQWAIVLVQFLFWAAVTALVVMAAESLTRRAFPEQIQLWKVWSRPVSSSPAVLGRTVSGFLLVTAFTVYQVVLYLFARKNLGWWNPSGALTDPNVLTSYFPWLTAVGTSLRAGITEECLFRAVPLACAALLGKRFGGRRYWILGALALQAVLFGGGHANYPAQPAYARLVELIVPAVGWGVLYLAFGLLPCIVCHFAVDVVFIGLPIFASSAPTAWIHQTIIVVLALAPLWIVLGSRLRQGKWSAVDEQALNRSWSPPPIAERPAPPAPVIRSAGLDRRTQIALIAAGCLGIVGWLALASFRNEAPSLAVNRAQATKAARAALAAHGVDLDDAWRELSTVEGGADAGHRFVWQEGGKDAYRKALGSYLWPPRWYVRYARFEGDVAERAEEYRVWTDGQGRVFRFEHQLPEARPAESLDEAQARQLARQTVTSAYALDVDKLEEVSAEPKSQPKRRDWTFVFKNPAVNLGAGGEARIAVSIAGDQVVDSYPLTHVPEDWKRKDRDRTTGAQIVQIAATVFIILLFITGGVIGILRWTRGLFSARRFVICACLLLLLNGGALANNWLIITSRYQTSVPFALQVGTALLGALLGFIVVAGAVGLNVGLVHRWIPPQPVGDRMRAIAAGVGLGAFIVAFGALVSWLSPDTAPSWAGYQRAGAYVPLLAAGIEPVAQWIGQTALLLLVLAAVHAWSRGWSRRRVLLAFLIALTGLALAVGDGVESPLLWLATGSVTAVVLLAAYVLVLRHHLALVPIMTATVAVLAGLREGFLRAFFGAFSGSLVGAVIIAALAWAWFLWLTADSRQGAVVEAATGGEAPTLGACRRKD